MNPTQPLRGQEIEIPEKVNFVEQGPADGAPVVLVHGLAASLHDWDALLPELAAAGYHAYALDLLGHGNSPKPASRAYRTKWLVKHFETWIESLRLTQPFALVGHSLGGYIALRYAMRHPGRLRALVLVDPFYRFDQLPGFLRFIYRQHKLNAYVLERTPQWIFDWVIRLTNVSLGRTDASNSTLPADAVRQTALDYKRTAPGAFNTPNTSPDLTLGLSRIPTPTLVIWGSHDQTLAPASFRKLVESLPHARGQALPGNHVPHQSKPEEFNKLVLEFLKETTPRP